MHPNMQKTEEPEEVENKPKGWIKYLYIFDEQIMKPIFIYKYNRLIQAKAGKMFNTYIDHGNEIEENFKIEDTKQDIERLRSMASSENASESKFNATRD